jgi:hypothetical protein
MQVGYVLQCTKEIRAQGEELDSLPIRSTEERPAGNKSWESQEISVNYATPLRLNSIHIVLN